MSGGNFVKLYGSILDSSIWSEDPWTRLLWVTMLAMADADGQVMASVPGLARRANIPLDKTLEALEVLTSPDAFDRSGVDEGRRLRVIPGGWLLVNYERYRELRTAKQVADAKRQADYRARNGNGVTGRDMSQLSREVSPSTSPSVDLEGEVQERGFRPIDFQAFESIDFGPYGGAVEGFLRSCRNPHTVVAILQAHLNGLDYDPSTPAELGLAVQEYAAAEQDGRFNPSYFAGFVRRARGRKAQARETANIKLHEERRAEEFAEAAKAAEAERVAVARFAETHPRRYAALHDQAIQDIANEFPHEQRGRLVMVRGRLQELITEEVRRAKS